MVATAARRRQGRRGARAPVPADRGLLPLIGYLRVSTAEQAESGAGLEAQLRTIEAAAERVGRPLLLVLVETASGKSVSGRPKLRRALRLIRRGQAGGIIAAKLDRLSRSVLDFAVLLDQARQGGWSLTVCDLALDTATPEGEALAHVLMAWAQFERRRIAQRTREGLAVKRSQGVRLGRPPALPAAVRARIVRERAAGAGWSVIARRLTCEGVPTAHGRRRWQPSTVRYIVQAAAPHLLAHPAACAAARLELPSPTSTPSAVREEASLNQHSPANSGRSTVQPMGGTWARVGEPAKMWCSSGTLEALRRSGDDTPQQCQAADAADRLGCTPVVSGVGSGVGSVSASRADQASP
jgi:DNA invertase Pin-like site-specific DNA recombinase